MISNSRIVFPRFFIQKGIQFSNSLKSEHFGFRSSEAYSRFRLLMLHIHGTPCGRGDAASYSGHFYESLYNVNPI